MSAAICPHPPLLVLGVGTGHDERLEILRGACRTAVDELRAADPELLAVVGAGSVTTTSAGGWGDFAAYGVSRPVVLPPLTPDRRADSRGTAHPGDAGVYGDAAERGTAGDPGDPGDTVGASGARGDAAGRELPLSLSVGAWLLEREGWRGPVVAATVAPSATRDECVRLGVDLAAGADRVAMLIMADGAAGHAPDETVEARMRARHHDRGLVAAIGAGEPAPILVLDPAAAEGTGATGLNPLRVLAGAAADATFDVDVLYDAAPFGVGYAVAVWERHG